MWDIEFDLERLKYFDTSIVLKVAALVMLRYLVLD
jgi:hypothetical protein